MSDLDLSTLLYGSDRNRAPIPPSMGQSLSLPRRTELNQARENTDAFFDTYCEVIRPRSTSGGFGEPDTAHELIGRYACFVGPAIRSQERDEDAESFSSNVTNLSEYEIIVGVHADIREEDRIAIPGWLNSWRAGHSYNKGDLIKPSQHNSGSGPYLVCVQGGLTGDVEPDWEHGDTFADNDAVWSRAGEVTFYEVVGVQQPSSSMTRKAVRVQVIR